MNRWVYLVRWNNKYDGQCLFGIFSSEDEANECYERERETSPYDLEIIKAEVDNYDNRVLIRK